MLIAAGASLLALVWTVAATVVGASLRPIAVVLCLLLAITPFAIGRRILVRETRIDIETLAGTIDIYVLFGMFFAALYATIEQFTSTAFFAQATQATANTFTYFSFVTLATLGYGDLTPATDLGRSLVVFEAMLGQIFLVTVIARVVAMLGTAPLRRPRD